MKKLLFLFALFLFGSSCFAAEPIEINFNDGIYHIILHGEKIKKKIRFTSNESLITNKEMHNATGAVLTINAGYFDPENQKTISYVTTDYVTSEDPYFNENLLKNPVLRKNLTKILNRTEFRILECSEGKTKFSYEIVPHNSPSSFGCSVRTAAQGGPLILPELRLEEEFFVVKKDGQVIRESASVLQKTARTIIGLKNGEAHILIITDEHPMDLYEVQKFCRELGLERAMAFDGGSSTSMNYKDEIEVISTKGDGAGRSVKSFMQVFN